MDFQDATGLVIADIFGESKGAENGAIQWQITHIT
jgi:hypothetical protein